MTSSLKKAAFLVTLGTLSSKAFGLARQLIVATAFGVNTAYDAYNYAYIVPGFFLILLGGINGSFHNAVVSILTKKSDTEGRYILTVITSIISTFLLLINIIIFLGADQIIRIVGPGLSLETHNIAVNQLRIMSPISFFAGLIGISFGSLNSRRKFLIPAIAPAISSIIIIIFIGYYLNTNGNDELLKYKLNAGYLIALATTLGAAFQWFIQIPQLSFNKLISFKYIWDLKHPGVKEVLKIIWPATLSTGMLQINVFTDLFFASKIASAAAGLSYANFIIQTPLGLISNAIIVPLLPELSRLHSTLENKILIKRITQGLRISIISMCGIAAILYGLAEPIIELIYKRGLFDNEAVNMVKNLLIAYACGMPFYLGRDLLVRVYYAIEESKTPFIYSSYGIFINIFLDWLLVGGPTPFGNQSPFNFGAPGLVYATAIVNLLTCLFLLVKLEEKLELFSLTKIYQDLIKILSIGILTGSITWRIEANFLDDAFGLILLIKVIVISLLSLIIFIISGKLFGINEFKTIRLLLKNRKNYFN